MLNEKVFGTVFCKKSSSSHQTDYIGLSCFFNVMSRDDDSNPFSLSESNQVMPDTLSQEWVDSNSRFVQNEKRRSMDKSSCQRHSSFLASTLQMERE